MVGFARLITDYVTFAYLTDVYVLREHQGKGLGRWMMECLNEVLTSWPGLRRTMLAVSDPNAVKLYEKTLGMEVVQPGKLSFMQALGPAAPARRL
jgi:ribosomal protein S18 acetylase RimI-like enzyme